MGFWRNNVDALLECKVDGVSVADMVQELFLVIRENIQVRRFERYEGVVSTYIHGGGRIGVMVKFDTTAVIAANDLFKEMGKDVRDSDLLKGNKEYNNKNYKKSTKAAKAIFKKIR